VHDRGRVLADLACAIADDGEMISDFRVIGDQQDLFRPGRVGSDGVAVARARQGCWQRSKPGQAAA
jgi:hypothetical protein